MAFALRRKAAAAAAAVTGGLIANVAAQSGPYTLTDATTTVIYTVTQGEFDLMRAVTENRGTAFHEM